MDFFEHIKKLRSLTRYAVILYILVVIVNTVVVNVLFSFFAPDGSFGRALFLHLSAAIIIAIMVVKSLSRLHEVRNPHQTAEKLNCRRLDNSDLRESDLSLRVLLNVVEEMALAASVVPPKVYLSNYDNCPNAVLIGGSQKSALIVTPAVLDLKRDELQALVGAVFGTAVYDEPIIDAIITGGMEFASFLRLFAGTLLFILLFSMCGAGVRGTIAFTFVVTLPFAAVAILITILARVAASKISRHKRLLHDVAAIRFTRSSQGIASLMAKFEDSGERTTSNLLGCNQRLAFSPTGTSMLDILIPFHPDWRTRRTNLAKYISKETPWLLEDRRDDDDSPMVVSGRAEAALLAKFYRSRSSSLKTAHKAEGRSLILSLIVTQDPKKRAAQIQYIRESIGETTAIRVELLANQLMKVGLNKLEILYEVMKDFESKKQFASICEKIIDQGDQTQPLLEILIHSVISQRNKSHVAAGEWTNLASQGLVIDRAKFLEMGEMILMMTVSKKVSDPALQHELIAFGLKHLNSDKDPKTLDTPDPQQYRAMLEELRQINKTQKDKLLNLLYDLAFYNGTASDDEKAFIRWFCEYLGLPFSTTHTSSRGHSTD